MTGDARVYPKAMCVCRHGDRILVQDLVEPGTGRRFYRPFGGEIEFGERAVDAVRREVREELGVDLTDVELLGVLESHFTYRGRRGHEIVFIFDGRLGDATLYERETIDGHEADGAQIVGVWLSLAEARGGAVPLYPDGLLELLKGAR